MPRPIGRLLHHKVDGNGPIFGLPHAKVLRANDKYCAVKSCVGRISDAPLWDACTLCVHCHQLLGATKTRSVARGEQNEA